MGFGTSEFEPVEVRSDRELTLGPMSLVGLGLALCAACGGCFLWGYSVGHRAPVDPVVQNTTAAGPSAAQMLSQNKPGATPASAPQKAQSQPAQESVDTSATAVSASAPTSVAATYPVAKQDKPAGQNAAVVQAALPAQGPGAQPVTAGGQVQSAMGSSTAWMVQIAAVSHQEDADVLTGALRKRGYVVTARRDPVDGLLHVQVGPFATHSEANSMRQRLLDDGYNAIIEP